MSVPIPLRLDFDAARVRGLAKKTKDGPQARRLLALAAIYDGATRAGQGRGLCCRGLRARAFATRRPPRNNHLRQWKRIRLEIATSLGAAIPFLSTPITRRNATSRSIMFQL